MEFLPSDPLQPDMSLDNDRVNFTYPCDDAVKRKHIVGIPEVIKHTRTEREAGRVDDEVGGVIDPWVDAE